MKVKRDGEASRAVILEALLVLPLGASLRDVAKSVGKHVSTVREHVHKLKKTGHLQVISNGYQRRRCVVPVRVRLGEAEREWLKLGVITARVIVVVARGQGKRVLCREVAKTLGWHLTTTNYHLQRARVAGIIEARHSAGYTLALGSDADREFAGLNVTALKAVELIAKAGRGVSCREIAEAFDLSDGGARWHLTRAVKAGLLTLRGRGEYAASAGADRINWQKNDLTHA